MGICARTRDYVVVLVRYEDPDPARVVSYTIGMLYGGIKVV